MKGTWKRVEVKGEALLQRSSHGISVRKSKMVLFGGEHEARVPLNSNVMEVDLKSGEAQTVFKSAVESKNAPPPRVAHSQTLGPFPAEKLFIFGGRQGIQMDEQPLCDLWTFDFESKKWEEVAQKGDVPSARSFHKMLRIGNKIYMFGGCGKTGRLADLHVFDIDKSTWTKLASSKDITGRGGPGFATSSDNKSLFVVGGFSGKEMSDIHRYDIASNSWTQVVADDKTIRPFSVSASATLRLGSTDTVVFFGGEVEPSDLGHEGAGGFSNDILLIDALTGKPLALEDFKVSTPLPTPRGWACADAWEGSKLVVYGGLTGDDQNPQRLDDVWVFSGGQKA